jgi:hypothetical protein
MPKICKNIFETPVCFLQFDSRLFRLGEFIIELILERSFKSDLDVINCIFLVSSMSSHLLHCL